MALSSFFELEEDIQPTKSGVIPGPGCLLRTLNAYRWHCVYWQRHFRCHDLVPGLRASDKASKLEEG